MRLRSFSTLGTAYIPTSPSEMMMMIMAIPALFPRPTVGFTFPEKPNYIARYHANLRNCLSCPSPCSFCSQLPLLLLKLAWLRLWMPWWGVGPPAANPDSNDCKQLDVFVAALPPTSQHLCELNINGLWISGHAGGTTQIYMYTRMYCMYSRACGQCCLSLLSSDDALFESYCDFERWRERKRGGSFFFGLGVPGHAHYANEAWQGARIGFLKGLQSGKNGSCGPPWMGLPSTVGTRSTVCIIQVQQHKLCWPSKPIGKKKLVGTST